MSDTNIQKPDYGKNYYKENRDTILAMIKKPIKCECGRTVQRATYRTHLNSIKHKSLLEGLTVFEYKLKNKL